MRSEELSEERGVVPTPHSSNYIDASRRGAGPQITSSTAERSPFPSRGRTKNALYIEARLPKSGERSAAAGGRARHCKSSPLSGALSPSPRRGRGTTLVVDEVIPLNVHRF